MARMNHPSDQIRPLLERLEPRLLLDAGVLAGPLEPLDAPAGAAVNSVQQPQPPSALPGDANDDGIVDGLDYVAWSNHYNQPGGLAEGDFTDNGFVDGLDYVVWSNNYNAALYSADVQLQNLTGSPKTDWPVFLSVWKVFGGNLDMDALNPSGFHVYDSTGAEVPHMLRAVPPDFSLGNHEIVFVVPQMAAGETLDYRVTNTPVAGLTITIDLANDPNNLLPNGGFESFSGGLPTGYYQASNNGVAISQDTTEVVSGSSSLLMTFPVGRAATIRTISSVPIRSNGQYHFSIWARTENVAYNGYGFWGCGGRILFEQQAFDGRVELELRDNREWYSYRFEDGPADSWGVPAMGPQGAADRNVVLSLGGYQQNQPFLEGNRTGRIWFDEALLFEQPAVTVDRATALARIHTGEAVVFARPVNMPRYNAFAHEAVTEFDAYAMRGERRRIRFGVHAMETLYSLSVSAGALSGPGLTLQGDDLELERLAYVSGQGDFFLDYQGLVKLSAGQTAEYMLSINVPDGAPAGLYEGYVTISAGGEVIATVPIRLEVLDLDAPAMDGYYIGGIYNMGYTAQRNDEFYVEYGKSRFNYLMLFDYFSAEIGTNTIDFAAATAQVDKLRDLAHVTGGIGLYREPNMSDDMPRKWYMITANQLTWSEAYVSVPTYDYSYETGYQDLAEDHQNYADSHDWPTQIYMVTDEPGPAVDKDPAMGWLNDRLPDAITCADVQYHDMVATWQWYNLPILDDPISWTGPLMYDYVTANEGRFGFCGTATGLGAGRYQHGLMMASSGAMYLHWWHVDKVYKYVDAGGGLARMHNVGAAGAGVNDFRYYLALQERIAAAGPSPEAAEAQALLDGVFGFATADNDQHVRPYNGVPAEWGYDRFYDDWRSDMKDYILLLEAAPPSLPQTVAAPSAVAAVATEAGSTAGSGAQTAPSLGAPSARGDAQARLAGSGEVAAPLPGDYAGWLWWQTASEANGSHFLGAGDSWLGTAGGDLDRFAWPSHNKRLGALEKGYLGDADLGVVDVLNSAAWSDILGPSI